jgi:hypothetical protein
MGERLAFVVIVFLASVGVSLVFVVWGLHNLSLLLRMSYADVIPSSRGFGGELLAASAAALVLAGVATRLAAIVRFRYVHRMTEAEVRGEQ